eukprot:TRINITY_DN9676_c0_g1_i1.p1 TRINITY_DN9676_c0_g1~~TRINITY_DN9676_c0_g1_i1.p1  ORF type:complete len:262 (+),score=46.27 TRINITY_DN9676_c0_g1_i1:129-914(+)
MQDSSVAPQTLVFNAASPNTRDIKDLNVTARVRSHGTELPPLDFSFCDVADIEDIKTVPPRSGVVHRGRATGASPPARSGAGGATSGGPSGGSTGATTGGTGGQTASSTGATAGRGGAAGGDADGEGDGAKSVVVYNSTAVKLCNNALANPAAISRALSLVVWDAAKHLSWLDLSFNQLPAIPPGLDAFPLQVLNLHSNRIADLASVRLLAPITTLRKLTLQTNPIEGDRHYKHVILAALPQLRSLDFTAITPRDRAREEQ